MKCWSRKEEFGGLGAFKKLNPLLPLAKTAPKTLYVQRRLLNGDAVLAWARSQGIESTLPPEDMHATIAFSRALVDWSQLTPDPHQLSIIEAGREVHQFPARTTPNGALVLKFESAQLRKRWQEFKDAGASLDFPEYEPHITLTYSVPEANVTAIEPYRGPLVFGPEEFAEVNEGWANEIVEVPTGVEVDKKYEPSRFVETGVDLTISKRFNPSQPRAPDGKWVESGLTQISSEHKDPRPGVGFYAGSGNAMTLNGYLRSGASDSPSLDKDVAKLTSEIAASPKLPEGAVVWRGVSGGFVRELQEGAMFTDAGFVSASLDKKIARFHAERTGKTPYLLRVDAGSAAGVEVTGSKEREVILQRATRFKVVKISGRVIDLVVAGNFLDVVL
jgi:hypothetical protein